MKTHFTPLYPDHLKYLKVHPVQTEEYNAMLNSAALDGLEHCTGVTFWRGHEVLGLAGVFQHWKDRAEAWVLVSKDMGNYALQVLPKVRYVLDNVPFRRVEMTVRVDNKHGHKLAKHLGFEKEGVLRAYWPTVNGNVDVTMYSRIRKP